MDVAFLKPSMTDLTTTQFKGTTVTYDAEEKNIGSSFKI